MSNLADALWILQAAIVSHRRGTQSVSGHAQLAVLFVVWGYEGERITIRAISELAKMSFDAANLAQRALRDQGLITRIGEHGNYRYYLAREAIRRLAVPVDLDRGHGVEAIRRVGTHERTQTDNPAGRKHAGRNGPSRHG